MRFLYLLADPTRHDQFLPLLAAQKTGLYFEQSPRNNAATVRALEARLQSISGYRSHRLRAGHG